MGEFGDHSLAKVGRKEGTWSCWEDTICRMRIGRNKEGNEYQ
jgi:hypothetical protein